MTERDFARASQREVERLERVKTGERRCLCGRSRCGRSRFYWIESLNVWFRREMACSCSAPRLKV